MEKKLPINTSKTQAKRQDSPHGFSGGHTELVNETLIHLGKHAAHVGRFFKRSVGTGKHLYSDQVLTFGIVGEADIEGICYWGYHGLEAKVGKDSQRESQHNWEKMVKRFGQSYNIFRSKEDALEIILKRWEQWKK